jgi:hypothetical protein
VIHKEFEKKRKASSNPEANLEDIHAEGNLHRQKRRKNNNEIVIAPAIEILLSDDESGEMRCELSHFLHYC